MKYGTEKPNHHQMLGLRMCILEVQTERYQILDVHPIVHRDVESLMVAQVLRSPLSYDKPTLPPEGRGGAINWEC